MTIKLVTESDLPRQNQTRSYGHQCQKGINGGLNAKGTLKLYRFKSSQLEAEYYHEKSSNYRRPHHHHAYHETSLIVNNITVKGIKRTVVFMPVFSSPWLRPLVRAQLPPSAAQALIGSIGSAPGAPESGVFIGSGRAPAFLRCFLPGLSRSPRRDRLPPAGRLMVDERRTGRETRCVGQEGGGGGSLMKYGKCSSSAKGD